MVSRCEGPRDTVCLPCDPDSYNEAVNYEACKPCTQCNQSSLCSGCGLPGATWSSYRVALPKPQEPPVSSSGAAGSQVQGGWGREPERPQGPHQGLPPPQPPPAPPGSGSELKKKCTPTQDTVCRCRPGTQPLDGFKPGVGEPCGGPGPGWGRVCACPVRSVPSVSPSGLGQKGHIKNGVPHQLPGKGQWAERTGVFQRPSTHPLAMGVSTSPTGPNSRNLRGQSSKTSGVFAADCAPCPAGHFSPGDNKACKPWTK
ncbi:Hypothetical predicted protein [Marmota monax]|uniref:TNFR-Cys domain-containing protein n=1 Tax=Marmota monax TaxID=9995 RepID=A0A5E4BCB3_MARMO|nr:Hypothetical predicted protein [Marmota monax]